MKKAFDATRRVCTFTAADGTEQVFNPWAEEVTDATREQLLIHGALQKIGDSYSGAGSEDDPEAYAKQRVQDLIAQLYANQWRASGEGGTKHSVLVRAFALASGITVEEAAEVVGKMDEAEQKALRVKPKIKVALEKIKLEATLKRLDAAEKAAAEEAKAAAGAAA